MLYQAISVTKQDGVIQLFLLLFLRFYISVTKRLSGPSIKDWPNIGHYFKSARKRMRNPLLSFFTNCRLRLARL